MRNIMYNTTGCIWVLTFSWFIVLGITEIGNANVEERPFVVGIDPSALVHDIIGHEISIHLRHNIVDPNNPKYGLVGLDASWAPKGIDKVGVCFDLEKDNKMIGSMLIGVFATSKLAREVLEETLLYTTVGPDMEYDGEFGDKAFGWWDEGKQCTTSVIFTRYNAAICIAMHSGLVSPADVSRDMVLCLAKKIDAAIVSGTHGVRRGSSLRPPRILWVEVPKNVRESSVIDLTLFVALQKDIYGDRSLPFDRRITKVLGEAQGIDMEHEFAVARTLRYSVPQRGETDRKDVSFCVLYFTPDCVVTWRQITLPVTSK